MNRIGRFLGNRYELLEQIGSGGMANVYKAKDHKLNRYVAVKILREEFNSDATFMTKFQQEAQAAASLLHPNIVNVYDVGKEDDINYIVMELCEGMTLKEYIRQKNKLEIFESINIAMQIASGIQAAHDHGIIHRDIKPQNIIITKDGKAKVTDFGIAKAASSQTISANTMGSVHYISPEQARGGVCDQRSDIYSLGITMYEMLTGRVPFDGDSTVAIALLHIQGDMIPPSSYEPMIPVSLEKIIMKCTQKRSEQRYESALELIEDLKKAMMMPNEDFVKTVSVDMLSGTKKFSEDDVQKIREKSNTGSLRTKEEDDYQMGIDEESVEPVEEEEEPSPKESDSKFERIVMAIGIAVLIIIIIVAIALAGHAMNMFPIGTSDISTQESESATLGANQTKMPDVVGLSLEDATARLQENYLGRTTVDEVSDKYDPGYVIHAEYDTGTILDRNTQVKLYVSSKNTLVSVPDVIGVSEKSAKDTLLKQDLLVVIKNGKSNAVAQGEVYDCDPEVGTKVQQGSTVTIYVSEGALVNTVNVPTLEDKTEDEAKDLLDEANLTGKSSYDYSDTVAEGNVISQNPEAGSSVEENSTVSYVVSRGPEVVLTTVPSVIGYSKADAEDMLGYFNLKVGEVSEEYDDTVPEGKVISQSVNGGIKVSEGSEIDLVISKGSNKVTVPTITGYDEATALSMLKDAGLNGYCSESRVSDKPEGTVIEVSPVEGSSVEKNSQVAYVLSSGTVAETETTQIENANTNTENANINSEDE